ncbi:hypothetical protein OHA37_06735 [Streptomyces sp. NBC_00335]|uniref:hypothetical protein n=1 Tax=unclassified Streptomyces TaxID=2593676 RepID=UPI0022539825|nr:MULTISPECIES: hypothetical protein [unclassified Streptomyces]MCX5403578.1 hypothetical protein [Streptomyces sp. NBC_00086]
MNHLDVFRLLDVVAPGRPGSDGYGQVVPEDFELLLNALPKGLIAASVKLTRSELPVRSLAEFTASAALRLEDMRYYLRSREQKLPQSLFPEPGGLVPWGRTADDGVLLWDTAAPDTADWTTVLADSDFQLWPELPFPTSEFIAREITGRADGTPAFETDAEYRAGSWHRLADAKRETAKALADRDITALDEILVKLRSLGVPGVRQYARELVEQARHEWPTALPEDYLAIMREFPGGIIAGARVFPVAGATWLDEDRQFLQWGEVEGRLIGWLTMKSDPQDWRIASIEPDGSSLTHLEDHTFATFLRRRLHGNNSLF